MTLIIEVYLKKNLVKNYFTYGVYKDSNFRITNIKYKLNRSIFDLIIKIPNKKKISVNNIEIPLIGLHNISNAAATFALTSHIGITTSLIKKASKIFKGLKEGLIKFLILMVYLFLMIMLITQLKLKKF